MVVSAPAHRKTDPFFQSCSASTSDDWHVVFESLSPPAIASWGSMELVFVWRFGSPVL